MIQPDADPLVFPDTNAAKQALQNDQVDAIVADVPTAIYITAVEIPQAPIVGQFQSDPASRRSSACCSRRATRSSPASNRRWPSCRDDGTLDDLE